MKNAMLLSLGTFFIVGCSNFHSTNIEKSGYSFFVAGHLYGKTWGNSLHIHEPFKNYIPEINQYPNVAFGIFTGDLVRHSTLENFETVVKDLNELKMPYYIAPGNHDTYNRNLYDSLFGDPLHNYRPYRSFKFQNDLFIILDGNLNHWSILGDQLNFLKKTLSNQANGSSNIFVFVHQLIYWSKTNEFKNIDLNWLPYAPDSTNYRSTIEPLLEMLNKPVYLFSGDLGASAKVTPYMYFKKKNVVYIASGMGGMKNDNFIFVNVGEKGNVSFDLIALQGDPHRLGKLEQYKMP